MGGTKTRKEVRTVESALDQKLDLSALHLGTISLGKLLGALLTLVICLIAVRLVTALLRRGSWIRPISTPGCGSTWCSPCAWCCGW